MVAARPPFYQMQTDSGPFSPAGRFHARPRLRRPAVARPHAAGPNGRRRRTDRQTYARRFSPASLKNSQVLLDVPNNYRFSNTTWGHPSPSAAGAHSLETPSNRSSFGCLWHASYMRAGLRYLTGSSGDFNTPLEDRCRCSQKPWKWSKTCKMAIECGQGHVRRGKEGIQRRSRQVDTADPCGKNRTTAAECSTPSRSPSRKSRAGRRR